MNSLESVILAVVIGVLAAAAGAVWLIVQRQSPGTWRMMVARQDDQEREIDELRQRVHQLEDERIVAHEEMAELRAEMAEWRRGMALVFDQMRAAGMVPVWQPHEQPLRQARSGPFAPLAQRIAAQFNIDEINSLAFDIGVLAEEFGGSTRAARARELVELMARRGPQYTAALLDRVKQLRGDTWQQS